jgi:rhodanese-related sulfurtransferase
MTATDDSTQAIALDAPTVQALIEANRDVLLVDVRTPGEYATAHIPGSVNLPLDAVDARLRRIVTDAGGRLVLVCQSGGRAAQAQQKLTAAGLTDVAVLAGGMGARTAAGAPVERTGRARWGLERQVRLVAGSIVLAAVVASIWVPALRYVAGFVGAGLVFAAVSDSCMLGLLLAKLPYNRGPAVDVDAAIARLAGPDPGATR